MFEMVLFLCSVMIWYFCADTSLPMRISIFSTGFCNQGHNMMNQRTSKYVYVHVHISRLRLFAVDGEENPKARADFIQYQITTCHGFLTHAGPCEVIAQVASYHFKRFPILGAAFTPTGDQAVTN